MTKYIYDTFGNETSIQDANGVFADGQIMGPMVPTNGITQFAYNAFGNQIGETLPLSQSESTVYNTAGQLDHSFEFKGNETKYTYDSLGRVHTISYYPSTNLTTADDVVTYAYTGLGQVYTVTETFASGPTRTDTIGYDADGNVTSDQSVQGTINQTVYHQYDPATGELMRTWTADGASDQHYSYDALGRLQTVTSGSQVTTYTYDLVGNLYSTTTVNGSTTTVATNTYDDLNRLIDLTNTVNGNIVSEYTYTLDQDGNRVQAVETLNGTTQTINYKYDALNRLTEEAYSTGLTIDYAYDLDGNRITETQTGGSTPGTTTSHYNADNELTRTDNADGTYTFYNYDANGSLTSTATAATLTGTQTTTATYTFNDRNRLVADTVGTTTDSYSYDDDGDRVSKTTGSTTTKYEIDGASPTGYDQVLAETNSAGTVQIQYVWGQQLVSETQSSTTSLYLFDGHGSVRQLADASSHTITDTYYYDSFGNLLLSSGTTTNVYRFASMRLDGNSGMYDDSARYYTPQTGEFDSRDPDGYGSNEYPLSEHRYLYANSNPINGIDPSGHDDFSIAGLLGGVGIASLVSGGIGAVTGAAAHGLRGAVAGFAGSASGTAISLLAIPIFLPVVGPLTVPLSFGLGSGLATVIEKLILDGQESLEQRSTWVEVAISFVAGAGLGIFSGAGTQYLAKEAEEAVASMPEVWNLLGQIENGTAEVLEREIAESGLTQDLPTLLEKYAPKFGSIIKELATDGVSDKLKEKVIVPAIQTFVELIDDLFVKRSGDPSLGD